MSHGGERKNAGRRKAFEAVPTRKVGITLTKQMFGYLEQVLEEINLENSDETPIYKLSRNELIEDMLRYALDKHYAGDIYPLKAGSFRKEIEIPIYN